jgi:hypothetical protein
MSQWTRADCFYRRVKVVRRRLRTRYRTGTSDVRVGVVRRRYGRRRRDRGR